MWARGHLDLGDREAAGRNRDAIRIGRICVSYEMSVRTIRGVPLSNGEDFAGYRIIRLLGAGGMGEVYLAQHPRLPRHDALKLLPKEWSGDAQYRSRFSREADLASTLWHPNIVGVHDRGEHDGQLWIAMDFVDGQDLSKCTRLRAQARTPPP